jgi:hypothetical protein
MTKINLYPYSPKTEKPTDTNLTTESIVELLSKPEPQQDETTAHWINRCIAREAEFFRLARPALETLLARTQLAENLEESLAWSVSRLRSIPMDEAEQAKLEECIAALEAWKHQNNING